MSSILRWSCKNSLKHRSETLPQASRFINQRWVSSQSTRPSPASPISPAAASAGMGGVFNAASGRQSTDEHHTHFGFQTIAESAKEKLVGAVFSSVASTYDTMNDLMSLGIHRLWKDHFVRSLNPGTRQSSSSDPSTPEGWRILDVAGGTGDIAFRMLDHASNINKDISTHVTVADINVDMLAEGRKRAATYNNDGIYLRSNRLSFIEANAEDLSGLVPDNSIDLYTVAFGIRNFTHKEAALKEAFRVLKPGGVFACLEFAPQLSNPVLNAIYKQWSFNAIPNIGQLVASDRESYQYLVESIEKFPSQEKWRQMIADAGFAVPPIEKGWEDLTFGIAAIHKGVKPLDN